jgi:hypothetical protein
MYTGMFVQLIAGPGAGQIAEITNYVGATKVATVGGNWVTTANPVAGCAGALGCFAQAVGSSATAIQLNAAEPFVPVAGQMIRLTGGTGAGQWAEIIAYDAATKTVAVGTAWALIPDGTTTYQFETPYRVQMASCKLALGGGQMAGWINAEASTSVPPVFQPVRPTTNARAVNLYVNRPTGLAAATPTLKTSTAALVAPCPVVSLGTCYQGQLVILVDNPAGTAAIDVTSNFFPANTINQLWCDVGAYLCGYAYPANHFMSMLTTGNLTLRAAAGGPDKILGNFFAVNSSRNASTKVLGRAVIAGTVITQQLDTSAVGQAVPFYQAPWNLNFLPQGSSPIAGALAVVLAANWKQVR